MTDLQGVCHKAYRCRINEDIIVVLSKVDENLVETLSCHQLGRVGRRGTRHQQRQVVVDARRNNLLADIFP